jgi:glutathione S-transferase
MLKVWGRTNSVNVQKVLWALAELGLPYERVDAGLHFGVVNEPFYRSMNPNGRIPTVEDDGLVLWESNAIVRYLCAKHSTGFLWPLDLRQRADADRWMDWSATTITPVITPLFWQLVRTPSEKRDAAVIASSRDQCATLFAMLNQRLIERPFLAGAELSMGDIAIGPFVHRWYGLPIERPRLEHLEGYYARLQERTPYREQVAHPLS